MQKVIETVILCLILFLCLLINYIGSSIIIDDDIRFYSGKRTLRKFNKNFSPNFMNKALYISHLKKVNYYHYFLFIISNSMFLLFSICILVYKTFSIELFKKAAVIFIIIWIIDETLIQYVRFDLYKGKKIAKMTNRKEKWISRRKKRNL